MKRVVIVEFMEMAKNKIFILLFMILTAYALIQNYYTMDKLFVGECEYVFDIANESGVLVDDVIVSDMGVNLIFYGHLLLPKASFALPLFIFSKYILFICVPLMCYYLNSDFSNMMVKQKGVYYGKFSYCIGKSIALSMLMGSCFVVMSVLVALESAIYKVFFLNQNYYHIYEYVSENVNNYALRCIPAIIFLMIIVMITSLVVCGLAYFSSIAFSGVPIMMLPFININVGFIVFPREVVAFMLREMLGKEYMGNFTIGIVNTSDKVSIYSSYLLWVVIALIASWVMISKKKAVLE